jgi:hypothetical protein
VPFTEIDFVGMVLISEKEVILAQACFARWAKFFVHNINFNLSFCFAKSRLSWR